MAATSLEIWAYGTASFVIRVLIRSNFGELLKNYLGVVPVADIKIFVARFLAFDALGCGIAAVVLPFFDGRVWKIGSMGWFAGGALLALLAIFLLLDAQAESRRS